MDHRVSVQKEDFSVAQEYEALAQGSQAGAVVTFVGKVRDMNLGDNVVGLHLEHYPGMTEKSLLEICDMAQERWPLQRVRVIHRIGDMLLKTRAPFWKKELTTEASRWIDSRDSDHQAAQRWE